MEFKNNNGGLLGQDISTLPVSADFIAQCKIMGFNTLKDIVNKGWVSLMADKGFTFRWLGELMTLLESNQLVHKLQAKPGTSR